MNVADNHFQEVRVFSLSTNFSAFIFSEDFEEYKQEHVTRRRQKRNSFTRTSSLGRGSVACGNMSEFHYLSNHQCPSCGDNDAGESKYKVIHSAKSFAKS